MSDKFMHKYDEYMGIDKDLEYDRKMRDEVMRLRREKEERKRKWLEEREWLEEYRLKNASAEKEERKRRWLEEREWLEEYEASRVDPKKELKRKLEEEYSLENQKMIHDLQVAIMKNDMFLADELINKNLLRINDQMKKFNEFNE